MDALVNPRSRRPPRRGPSRRRPSGPASPRCASRRRHLRLGPALLPARRLRHGPHPAADGARPRVAGVIEEVGAGVAGFASASASPSARAGPAALPLLPARPAEPLPRHALVRQSDAHAARAGRVTPADRGRTGQAHLLADGVSDDDGAMAEPLRWPCTPSTAPARCWASGAGDRLRADRRDLVVAARRAGATHIVATDVVDAAAARGRQGRRRRDDQRRRAGGGPRGYTADKGRSTSCSSPRQRACAAPAFESSPRGVVVQLGLSAAR